MVILEKVQFVSELQEKKRVKLYFFYIVRDIEMIKNNKQRANDEGGGKKKRIHL